MRMFLACALLAACGFRGASLGGDGGPLPPADTAPSVMDGAPLPSSDGALSDGAPVSDGTTVTADAAAAGDAAAAPTITISGVVAELSFPPSLVAGVSIAAIRNGIAVATTTSGANGAYALTVARGFDGYLHATLTGHLDTYVYPPTTLTADFPQAQIQVITPATAQLITQTGCGTAQTATTGLVGLEVTTPTFAPVSGAVAASAPAAAKVCYDGAMGPSGGATATGGDGIAILINVPAGTTTVSATKVGTTFQAHAITAIAGALATTYVTQ